MGHPVRHMEITGHKNSPVGKLVTRELTPVQVVIGKGLVLTDRDYLQSCLDHRLGEDRRI